MWAVYDSEKMIYGPVFAQGAAEDYVREAGTVCDTSAWTVMEIPS